MKDLRDFIFCFLKKLFSRNFMLPLVCAILIYKIALVVTDPAILKIVCPALVVVAIGYNGLGALNTFIKGKNGNGK